MHFTRRKYRLNIVFFIINKRSTVMACEDNNLKCLYLQQFNLRFISHPDTHLSLSHLLNLCTVELETNMGTNKCYSIFES